MFAFSCHGDPDIRHMAGPSGHLAGSTTAGRGFLRWWLCDADALFAAAARPSWLNDGIRLHQATLAEDNCNNPILCLRLFILSRYERQVLAGPAQLHLILRHFVGVDQRL
jgi:hypothetical protein